LRFSVRMVSTIEEGDSVKRRRTPTEKKALSYKKDHAISAEYPHAFRRQWPRKKARVQRKERRQVNQSLTQVTQSYQEEQGDDILLKPIQRNFVESWGDPVPLGIWVKDRQFRRIYRTAWNFFKVPYTSNLHRDSFKAFLQIVTKGRTIYSGRLAQLFSELLSSSAKQGRSEFDGIYSYQDKISKQEYQSKTHWKSDWLRAFLKDEPEWEERLRAWIAEFENERERERE
jgi:hypothetical protein